MPTSRTPILDWLRHGLALMVICSHSIPLLLGTGRTDPLMRLTNGQLTFGTFAVFLFFALSGYLITASWQRDPNVRSFLYRRLSRILPAWIAAMVFGAVVVLPLVSGQWPHDPQVLVGYLPVPSVLPNNPYPWKLNAAIWTIPYELLCYLLVVLFGVCGSVTQRGIIAILVTFSSIVALLYMQLGAVPLQLLFITAFWAGGLARHTAITRRYAWIHWLVVATIPFVIASQLVIVLLPVYAYWLLTWLPQMHAPALPVDWSYGLYVYSFPIQQGLVAAFGSRLTPPFLTVACLCISVPICATSWRWVESPMLRWANTRIAHVARLHATATE